MYTVAEAHIRVLQETDKAGSDYFDLKRVLDEFQKVTWDFVGARAKEIEITQEVTDDIRTLLRSEKINLNNDPDNNLIKMAALPNQYYRRLKINVLFSDGIASRKTTVQRHGEADVNLLNPLKKPDRSYPLVTQFDSYFSVDTGLRSGDIIVPEKLLLVYLKKPNFGKQQTAAVVDLPDDVCEHLFAMTANSLLNGIGDERTATDFQIENTYRKK